MRRLRPFFPYYGSKWRLAPLYPAPEHPVIFEPFAGSACYSLEWWMCQVRLCDLGPMAALWAYLIRASATEIRNLPLIAPEQSTDEIPTWIVPEARHLIGLWCHRGIPRVARRSSSWRKSGRYDGHFWSEKTRERVASQLQYIRHWRVVGTDYRQCDGIGTYFVDPPYSGYKGKRYDGASGLDYVELAIWVRERRGQVLVCESEGADWLPFKPFKETRGVGVKRYTEVLYVRL